MDRPTLQSRSLLQSRTGIVLLLFLLAFGFTEQALSEEAPTPLLGAADGEVLIWQSEMTAGSRWGFVGYVEGFEGSLTDDSFSMGGRTFTVRGVVSGQPGQDTSANTISLYIWPGLPQASRHMYLKVGDLSLNLADGRVAGQHFLWTGVDLNWTTGDTVEVSLWECPPHFEPRSFDGRGNNSRNPVWGRAGATLLRLAEPNSYRDGVSAMIGSRPNPRAISNRVFSQNRSIPNTAGATDMLWQWGQFIDHDITLSLDNLEQPIFIPVPRGDAAFDPGGTGQSFIMAHRSASDPRTGTGPDNPRRQTNVLTAFVDGSQVYGSDVHRARALRTNDGTGRLLTSNQGRMLPYNSQGLENEGGSHLRGLFVAGDVRVNEQIGLISMHTLFVREHNRLAEEIARHNPGMNGDLIYQLARKIVGAHIQAVTFYEFLPLLLGSDALAPYTGYDPAVNPTIASEFSAAAYRVGHTFLSPDLLIVDPDGATTRRSLAESFFNPDFVRDTGISAVLRGLATNRAQQVDSKVIGEVRNFLLRGPTGPKFDLVSLNIQRGRDHGLADFNTVRRAYGLAPVDSFADISSDVTVQRALRSVYPEVADLDLWVGALAEDHAPGAMVGETLRAVISDQFRRLRDGDRLYFENDPYLVANPALLQEIRSTTLADIIRRNTPIQDEISDNVFITVDAG